MGCHNSRLNASKGDEVPFKMNPLLSHRFEESRKRGNGATLRQGTLTKKKLLKDAAQDDDNTKSSHETREKSAIRVITLWKADARKDDDDEEEEGDEENNSHKTGRLACLRSPSFKIYCNEEEKRKDEICEQQIIAMHHKSPSVDSVESAASASASWNSENSNEGVERKRNKRKKLGAVKKNLLNVKSCYNPMSCTGNDSSRLLEANRL